MVLISGFSICYICEKTKFVYISIDKFSRYTVQSLVFRNFRFYTYFRKFTRQYFISLYLSKQYLAIKVFGMIAYFVDAFVHKTDFNRVWPRNRVATPQKIIRPELCRNKQLRLIYQHIQTNSWTLRCNEMSNKKQPISEQKNVIYYCYGYCFENRYINFITKPFLGKSL